MAGRWFINAGDLRTDQRGVWPCPSIQSQRSSTDRMSVLLHSMRQPPPHLFQVTDLASHQPRTAELEGRADPSPPVGAMASRSPTVLVNPQPGPLPGGPSRRQTSPPRVRTSSRPRGPSKDVRSASWMRVVAYHVPPLSLLPPPTRRCGAVRERGSGPVAQGAGARS